jgi:Zn-dependent peptidase ImmA (M78 family)
MKHRWGFKTEANAYARDMRSELGVEPHGPLCPWELVEHLGYIVMKLSDFLAIEPKAVAYFSSGRGQAEFSAVTLPNDGGSLIVYNDSHSPGRQAANLAHEAAHGILCHESAPLTDDRGVRIFNRVQENEASWLGPALLISDEAALYIVEQRLLHAVACEMYGVSLDLLQMRLRVTAAHTRVARRRAA